MLESVRRRALDIWREHGLLNEPVTVQARTLTVHEALGDPEGDDFPLQKGKEQLMEAEFRGAKGQAFTDRYGDFSGTLADVAAMPLENNFRRAVFVASVNATVRLVRSRSRTCSSSSSARICWLSGGCDMPRRSAARLKCSSSATTMK